MIPEQTKASQKNLRSRYKSIRRGKSKSARSEFFGRYLEKKVKMDDTKLDPKDLDSPCQELFVRSLGFLIALLVRSRIDLCVCVY